MTYNVHLEQAAQRDLLQLDTSTRIRLLKRLKWFGDHFADIHPETLTGAWAGYFKFRVGDYRAIYQVDHPQLGINIYRIRHRREVYK